MRLLVAALLLLAAVTHAHAQLIDTGATCKAIADASRILTRQPTWQEHEMDGAILQLCTFKDGRVYSATVYEAPRKNGLGLCAVKSEDLTIRRHSNGAYYQPSDDPVQAAGDTIRQRMLRVGDGACPSAIDDAYLAATGTPDGVFVALLDMWKTIHDTPSSLDGLLALDDKDDRSIADGVQRDFSNPKISARLVLTGIVAESAGFRAQRSTGFTLVIHDTADWYEWYELSVDWTPNGWRIVAISLPAV